MKKLSFLNPFRSKKAPSFEGIARWQKPVESTKNEEILPNRLKKFTFRDRVSVARRTVIVSGVTHAAFGCERKRVLQWLRQEGLWKSTTKWEREFLSKRVALDHQFSKAQWRLERLWMLAWTLEKIDEVEDSQACGPQLKEVIPGPGDSTRTFIESSALRHSDVLNHETKRLERVIELLAMNDRLETHVDAAVIQERFHVLNWMAFQQSWEED